MTTETTAYKGPTCRGCWALGTACGKCERCLATKPADAPIAPPSKAEPPCGGFDSDIVDTSPQTLAEALVGIIDLAKGVTRDHPVRARKISELALEALSRFKKEEPSTSYVSCTPTSVSAAEDTPIAWALMNENEVVGSLVRKAGTARILTEAGEEVRPLFFRPHPSLFQPPQGWTLVPREASLSMLDAGWGICGGKWHSSAEYNSRKIKEAQVKYNDLLASRPSAPAPYCLKAMSESDMLKCLGTITHEVPTRIPLGWRKLIRAVEAHHKVPPPSNPSE
jgi:hypothetical protein